MFPATVALSGRRCVKWQHRRDSLPENVISANTVNTFKNRLDKFWSDQELVYDYKADLTGIGNRV